MDEAKPFIESSPGAREKGACDHKSSFAQIEASERQQSPKQPVQPEPRVALRTQVRIFLSFYLSLFLSFRSREQEGGEIPVRLPRMPVRHVTVRLQVIGRDWPHATERPIVDSSSSGIAMNILSQLCMVSVWHSKHRYRLPCLPFPSSPTHVL